MYTVARNLPTLRDCVTQCLRVCDLVIAHKHHSHTQSHRHTHNEGSLWDCVHAHSRTVALYSLCGCVTLCVFVPLCSHTTVKHTHQGVSVSVRCGAVHSHMQLHTLPDKHRMRGGGICVCSTVELFTQSHATGTLCLTHTGACPQAWWCRTRSESHGGTRGDTVVTPW